MTTPPARPAPRKATGRGLGKGLGALIPSGPATASVPPPQPEPVQASAKAAAQATPVTDVVEPASIQGLRFAELPIDAIVPNPRQPRTVFDEDALAELVFSVREVGLLQPIVVRPRGARPDDGYELIAGERRFRACTQAGMTAIPALIRETDDDALLRDALLENLHRADLNALEEAAAYQQLLSDFGCTQEELAGRIGRSRAQVTNLLRLLRLPAPVQRKVAAGVLSAGHARALLSLDDPAAMERLADRIIAEGLSVRSVEELIILGEADGKERQRKQRRKRGRSQEVDEIIRDIVGDLSDALDTKVDTAGFATMTARGRIVIECADVEDLRRVRDAITGD